MIGRLDSKVTGSVFRGVVCVLIAAFLVAGFADTAPAKTKKITWSVFISRASTSGIWLREVAKLVKKFSNGALELKMYYAGEIAETKELVDLCRAGTIDMITTAPTYYPDKFPINANLQNYTPLIPSVGMSQIIWRTVQDEIPEFTEEYTRQNMKLFARGHLGMYYTISKKPIRGMDDLKGMKIRIAGGKYLSDLFSKAGAVAVFLPSIEAYEGLMRGTIDATVLTLGAFKAYKLYEPAKNVGFPIGGMVAFSHTMNLDKWKSLTPDEQQIFKKAWDYYLMNDLERTIKEDNDYQALLEEKGCKFYPFPKKDWQALLKAAGDPWEHLKKTLKDAGQEKAGGRLAEVWSRLLKVHGYEIFRK
jgi:TRAP-type C4-dicarboxylate transport system substrate-binding protein